MKISLGGTCFLKSVNRCFGIQYKYLGHIINNSLLDDADIYRGRRNVFYRCNMLARRFYSCSVAVKLRLFKSFCLCFDNLALWNNFTIFH